MPTASDAVPEARALSRAPRPPRAMAWVLLGTSGLAILVVGGAATLTVLARQPGALAGVPHGFWVAITGAAALTIVSLALRTLRWIFLLRRSETRLPIRDAYVGYVSGLSLLVVPLLLGEIAVRAVVHRRRGGVPVTTTVAVNLWERVLDLSAVTLVAGVGSLALGMREWRTVALAATGVVLLVGPLRRYAVTLVGRVAGFMAAPFEPPRTLRLRRLGQTRTFLVALATSVAAWILPGLGLWLLVRVWIPEFDPLGGVHAYALSASLAGLLLAPGGILVAGNALIAILESQGVPGSIVVVVVLGVRLVTVGVATALGWLFLLIHWRSVPATGDHFDAIAEAYDVQIPEFRRVALVTTKTEPMRDVLTRLGTGVRGLDVGCGQGAYVMRMRELGFDVVGIDESAEQVRRARRKVGDDGLVSVGSILEVPAPDGAYDFAYVINVLHHLPSVERQRQAFAELFRVVKPGGVVFVHEINTRNVLFRFYMGYVFPSLNCIDEGVERWLLPHRLHVYTDRAVLETRYFTFLPDFIPQRAAGVLAPLERVLEASPLRVYSAHYMAVIRNVRCGRPS